MTSLPLDSIIIDRPARQRRRLDSIEALANSISRAGLIHPPVITRENVLVAGERRITAMRSLGWTSCPVTFTDELDPATLALVELEENISRKDIHWKDEVLAVIQYHKLRSSEPGWNKARLASALGRDESAIHRIFIIAEELTRGNMLVSDADKLSVAWGIASRARERRHEDEREQMRAVAAPAQPKEEENVSKDSVAVDTESGSPSRRSITGQHSGQSTFLSTPILNADFIEWSQSYSGRPFNLIHCDFPYGVNVEARRGQMISAQSRHGAYVDSPDTYWRLLTALAAAEDQLCAESAHMLFWFSMDYYTETLGFFAREMPSWTFQPFPLYWSKSDNAGVLPDHKRGPRRVVETALLGARGDRKIIQAVANHVAAPTDREHHISTKPIPVLAHFFRMLVDEGTRLLDPTCGSATSLCAARAAGAAQVLGIERDPEFHRRAVARYAQSCVRSGEVVA